MVGMGVSDREAVRVRVRVRVAVPEGVLECDRVSVRECVLLLLIEADVEVLGVPVAVMLALAVSGLLVVDVNGAVIDIVAEEVALPD